MTNMSMWKKTLISSMALVMLAGGATSAFADAKGGNNGKNNGKGNGWHQNDRDRDDDDDDDDDKDDKYNIRWQFKDEEELQWALEYIMRLASKGVFTGYEDGTFKPHQKISRIETLTAAVRLMGLRAEAESAEKMNTDLHFKDGDKVKKKYPWAVGYVAVALENDLFFETDTEVKPEQNATRLWSTILLIKSLKLEDEAKALNNTKLEFKDAKEIPAGAVGYVALALEKGIITGYEDKHGNKTFRPNQPVTRAELAALLDRTDSEMPDHDASAIEGTLKAAPANGQLTVVKSDNKELTLTVDPNVFIFRDDKKAALSALQPGDKLFIRTYQNRVVFIEVTQKAAETVAFESAGLLKGLTFDANANIQLVSILQQEANGAEKTVTLSAAQGVKIVGDASLLVKGQPVILKGKDNVVQEIQVVAGVQAAAGKLKAEAAGNKIVIVKADNTEVTVELDANTFIYREGKKTVASELNAGDEVYVRYYSNGKAAYVEVTKAAPDVVTFDVTGQFVSYVLNAVGKISKVTISLTVNGEAQAFVYNVAENVSITGNISEISAGKTIQLKGQNGFVTNIIIPN